MYKGLQVGRGIAALLVVLHHATLGGDVFYGNDAFKGFWDFGHIGVDFFFVLSGFIIYWVHSNDSVSVNNAVSYIKKRLIRIYPPFILISVVLLLSYAVLPSVSETNRDIGIITSLLLIPTPPLEPALSVSWTLMHEMLFYSAFLILFVSRNVLHVFLVGWGFAIASFNLISDGDGILNSFFLNPHNLQFLFGVAAAIIVKKEKQNSLSMIVGLTMLATYLIGHQYHAFENASALILKTYLGICFMFIVVGLCSVESRVQYPGFFVFLGAASYSVYLVHNPVISLANRISHKVYQQAPLIPEVFFIVTATLGVISGIVYYLLWEKPSLQYLKRTYLKKQKL